jgi:hypothetical protein
MAESAYALARAAFLAALRERERAAWALETVRETTEIPSATARYLAADLAVEARWMALWEHWFAAGCGEHEGP